MKLNKKIIGSLATVAAVAALAIGATGAFFSDEEKSLDNTFEAGAIDLKIDNESYVDQGLGLEWRDDLSWGEDGGAEGVAVGRFFDIKDMKPGDNGEDTISIHLATNPAWVCVDLEITANSDEDCTEPENDVDAEDGSCVPEEGGTNGDLAKDLNFAFWADDGDNVYEEGEEILTQGPATNVLGGVTWALADSLTGQGPMNPTEAEPHYIGKAWCYGTLEMIPVPQEPYDRPTTEVKGYTCDGSEVGNEGQTDLLTGDITFRAVQSRHNEGFVCSEPGGPQVETRNISLENKDNQWAVLSDDQTYGDIEYSHNDTSLHGEVTGTGLAPEEPYQITLNGPGGCTFTDDGLAGVGPNAFSSGYWNNGTNLEPTCGAPGEGVYNMDLVTNWYTVLTDGSGAFSHNFDFALPAGDYSGVKVLVKRMLDPFVSPWAYFTGNYMEGNLYETAPISFTIVP